MTGVSGRARSLAAALVRRGGAPAVSPSVPEPLLELLRRGPEPLAASLPDAAGALAVATIVPSYRRGSGGHATVARLMRELRARGHAVSLWLEDCEQRHASERRALTQRSFADFFDWDGEPLHCDYGRWAGADVVIATGWQTVARALLLPGAGARAYLVQDHEPDFYGASAQALWAADTYRRGLHCIAASPWLAELLRERYGASVTPFDLAFDHDLYRPEAIPRRDDLVVFYARAATPRRAVPLGLAALSELTRRREGVEVALFGESAAATAAFPHTDLGVLDAVRLADLYRRASVGMSLSLTNPSLISLEMMACGLPCVELASESMLSTFGAGPPRLCEPDPLALCAALERLLDDPVEREREGQAGVRLMAARSWPRAAGQVEDGLRAAVRLRA
jgi:glycosyltransferase involved in cell wall biosynthesis